MTQETHIVLNNVYTVGSWGTMKTISTNPHNILPYKEQSVKSSIYAGHVLGQDEGLFGALGVYNYPQSWEPQGECKWKDITPYGKHDYLIVVVLGVNNTQTVARVYDEFKGEFPITVKNNLPYIVSPQVGHKLLLKRDGTEYNIIHNITLAKLKWERNQHII